MFYLLLNFVQSTGLTISAADNTHLSLTGTSTSAVIGFDTAKMTKWALLFGLTGR